MAFFPSENRLGIQPIAVPVQATTLYQTGQSTQFYASQHKLGEIVRAIDPTYGGGEFIYLYGVASTLLGSLVIYDQVNGTTTLAPQTSNLNKPLAVAMSACVSGYYGWYQISGAAVVKKVASAYTAGGKLYLSATTGRVTGVVASGQLIQNMYVLNAATTVTSNVTVAINRPFAQSFT